MKRPAEVCVHSSAGLDPQHYRVCLRYEVHDAASRTPRVHFELEGEIDGQPFLEHFELPGAIAFNFAASVTRILARHGLRVCQGAVLRFRKEHDLVFDDLRRQLPRQAGTPLDLQRLASLAPLQAPTEAPPPGQGG